ncbi:MAG TPA: alpha-amylase family glycosyl hydrolase [Flavisolibacter sp.]|nr:alpha-amylase family glycosyl hydrolase [Flavisolibacter sp.]
MKRLLLIWIAAACSLSLNAQLLTWTPAFPKETDAITITVDATKGNRGLLNFTGNVYVHVGAITNLSTGPSNWLYAPFTWGSTEGAALATPDGPNKWKYTINNPRIFFNLAAGEQLRHIAILFRAGSCSNCQAQRNSDGSDMYIRMYSSDLAVRIDQPAREPRFIPVPEQLNWVVGTNFNLAANASSAGAMKLYHNGVQIASQAGVQTLSAASSVTALGNQQLIAEVNNGTVTRYDTINVFVSPASSPVSALPAGVRDGINYEPGDTSVTLVLRAPAKNIVTVVGDFNNWTQDVRYIMNKTPDGKFFWLRIHPLTAGTEYAYQYVVDDSIRIADPYAEKVLDPFTDQNITPATYPGLRPYPAGQSGIVGLLRTGATPYNWTSGSYVRPDKRGLVIYELLIRDFVAARNWKTVGDSLNYLKNLGINAIEIMPFNEFENHNSWGYDPTFYFAPDKSYGPANSLKAFVDSCHKRGIAVIMDIALNHAFGRSPMVQLYWDAANNRPAANSPWFNPVTKHAFNVGFDMNHESLDTRYFVSRVMEHWVQQYRIDGFRFDLSKGFTQNATCDAGGNNCNVGNWGNYDASRVAIWKRYYDSLQLKSAGAYAVLEHFADVTEERELSDYGMLIWGNLNHSYSQAAKGVATDWDFSGGIHTVRNFSKPHLITYMESHDEERVVYRNITEGNSSGGYNIRDTATALKRMELAAAFLFTIPGPKMIWQFGELGYDYPINYCVNGTINNNCRLDLKPIKWSYFNEARRRSVYNTYSKLINLRHHSWYKEAFLSGTISRDFSGAAKWLRVSSGDTSHLVVVGNFGVSTQAPAISFPLAGTWFDYLNNTTLSATGVAQTIVLQPGEFRVYVNRNVNNVAVTPVGNVPWNGTELQAAAYPNPASAAWYIELDLPQSSNVNIELYNSMGQAKGSIYQGFLTRGSHKLPLNRGSLAAGTYYLKLITKTNTKTIQVTFQ